MKLKKAMILSAGFGKRMAPMTLKVPKSLIKINGVTLLENSILLLKKFGIDEIVINTYYLSDQIENYIKEKKFNITIKIVREKNTILDTGGGILNATTEFKNDPFIVLNPDTIWNKLYLEEFEYLEKIYFEKKMSTLLLVNKNKSFDKSFKGDFNINKNGLVLREDTNEMIYTGAQVINRKIFKNCSTKPFSMNKIWDELINKKLLAGYESQQEFLHINNNKIYEKIISEKLIH